MFKKEVLEAESYLSLFRAYDPQDDTKALLQNTAVEGVSQITTYHPQAILLSDVTGQELIDQISFMGRMCWDADWKKDPAAFIKHLIKVGHTSVIEHSQIAFLVLSGRDTSHEVVRHRIGMSPTQQSQRYIKYSDPSKTVPVVMSYELSGDVEYFFTDSALMAIDQYRIASNLMGMKPEDARLVLPNQMGTIYGLSFNLRSLRNFFELRMAKGANHRVRAVANDMFDICESIGLGMVFDDLNHLRQYDPRVPFAEWGGLESEAKPTPAVICPADRKICTVSLDQQCSQSDEFISMACPHIN
jgi:thymidylate synthase (FAD)